ncbi:response regulator transcription factor [Chloroflexota bacterium]
MTKILIVDDEEYILDLLVAVFNDIKDIEILCARDGREALSIAEKNIPDIVLLDAKLPKLDGYQACKLIKKNPAMSHTKVLMISGMTQNSDLIKAREAGVDDYISKPFTSTVLIERVEKVLKRI